MAKMGNIKLKTLMFIGGIAIIGIATGLVKITSDPKMEILWAFVATGGIALVALSKYI